jgi:hypothetical protein
MGWNPGQLRNRANILVRSPDVVEEVAFGLGTTSRLNR